MTAVLAEDETVLRLFLKKKLEKLWPELSVVGEAEHGLAAVELITTLKPTVAFLDIRMPELTGLEVASRIAEESPDTHIVFVTAYHEYAVAAFDRGAVDYVLKPIQEAGNDWPLEVEFALTVSLGARRAGLRSTRVAQPRALPGL